MSPSARLRTSEPEAMRAHAGDAARPVKALANDQRVLVLCLLVEGEGSVGELNEQLDLSQPALSQHLARLDQDGLVQTWREAQIARYRVSAGPVQRPIQTLQGIYCDVG
jgi:DNA-binding transcriptional ArsR family regulator